MQPHVGINGVRAVSSDANTEAELKVGQGGVGVLVEAAAQAFKDVGGLGSVVSGRITQNSSPP